MVRPDAALRPGLSRRPASRPEPAPPRDREPGAGWRRGAGARMLRAARLARPTWGSYTQPRRAREGSGPEAEARRAFHGPLGRPALAGRLVLSKGQRRSPGLVTGNGPRERGPLTPTWLCKGPRSPHRTKGHEFGAHPLNSRCLLVWGTAFSQ